MLWMCFYPVFFFFFFSFSFFVHHRKSFSNSTEIVIHSEFVEYYKTFAKCFACGRFVFFFGLVYCLSRYILLCRAAAWFLIKTKSKNKALLCVCVCVCFSGNVATKLIKRTRPICVKSKYYQSKNASYHPHEFD